MMMHLKNAITHNCSTIVYSVKATPAIFPVPTSEIAIAAEKRKTPLAKISP
jgi:hypothetical protein